MLKTEIKAVKLSVVIPRGNPDEKVRVVILDGDQVDALPTKTECSVMGWPLYTEGGGSTMTDHMTASGIRLRPSNPASATISQTGALAVDVRRNIASKVVTEYCTRLAELLASTARLRESVVAEEHVEVTIPHEHDNEYDAWPAPVPPRRGTRPGQTISRVISAMEARIMIVTETKPVKLCVEIPQASHAENVRVVILNGNDLLALPTRTECQVMGWPLYAGGDSVMIDHMTDGGEIRQRPSAPGNALTQNGDLVLEVRRDSARAVVAAYCEKLAELLSATAKLRATIMPEETVEVAIA